MTDVTFLHSAPPQHPRRLHRVFPGRLPADVPGDGLPGPQVPQAPGQPEDGGDSLHQPGELNLQPLATDRSRQQENLTF